MHEPTNIHLNAAKILLSYLGGTSSFGLFYDYGGDLASKGFCDVDWAIVHTVEDVFPNIF